MKKSIAWILTVIMMLALLTGCGSKSAKSDTEYVKKNGKLIVGITDYEPMDYKDENGEWTGFDAEFARMFAKELGVDCEFFVIADWGQKFFELDSKNIDAIWNGMTITDEVTLNTNCSNPYVVNAQVVIMKADVVGNYTSTDSLKDLTFAVESGSAGEDAVKDLGITDYVAVQDQTKAVMEVSAGTADACVVDITLANAMTGEGTADDHAVDRRGDGRITQVALYLDHCRLALLVGVAGRFVEVKSLVVLCIAHQLFFMQGLGAGVVLGLVFVFGFAAGELCLSRFEFGL